MRPPVALAPLAGVGGAEGGLNRDGDCPADVTRQASEMGMEWSRAGGAAVGCWGVSRGGVELGECQGQEDGRGTNGQLGEQHPQPQLLPQTPAPLRPQACHSRFDRDFSESTADQQDLRLQPFVPWPRRLSRQSAGCWTGTVQGHQASAVELNDRKSSAQD